jgi:hypothetical protein
VKHCAPIRSYGSELRAGRATWPHPFHNCLALIVSGNITGVGSPWLKYLYPTENYFFRDVSVSSSQYYVSNLFQHHHHYHISLLMSPQQGGRPFFSIIHKENVLYATYGPLGANDCKCSRDQQLNMPSEARRSSR